jgi:hypothetical protein
MRAVIVSQPSVWGCARQIELGTHRTASAAKQSDTAGNCCEVDEMRDDVPERFTVARGMSTVASSVWPAGINSSAAPAFRNDA